MKVLSIFVNKRWTSRGKAALARTHSKTLRAHRKLTNVREVLIPAVMVLLCWASWSRADDAGEKAVAETRRALRKEGFKTDFADFDLSISPELRARSEILKEALDEPVPNATNANLPGTRGIWKGARPGSVSVTDDPPDLMETVGSNSAAVVWKLAAPGKLVKPGPGRVPFLSWDDFRKAVEAKGPQLDRAEAAIFAGPIRFDLSRQGGRYRQPAPLSRMWGLARLLGYRLVLALHDGDQPAAWSNLSAATRFVTAWEPEPPQSCQLASFATTEQVFQATWQALQTNGWSDAELAQLQTQWQSVDFFTRLPETAAYMRASAAAASERARVVQESDVSLDEFMGWGLRFPVMLWFGLNYEWQQEQYRQHGSYVDEVSMLQHYRDAEVELRRAVQAPTWSQMHRIPAPSPPVQYRLMVMDNETLLSHAAQAEARRRIIIAALALERYRARHGAYPRTLAELAPEFLSAPPVDFMDGQPLRYRLTEGGHFILYSVGLGGDDNGGRLPRRGQHVQFGSAYGPLSKSEIVWPLPASAASVQAVRLEETKKNQGRQGWH